MNNFSKKLGRIWSQSGASPLAGGLAAILIFCSGSAAAMLWRAQADEQPRYGGLSKTALAKVISALDCERVRLGVISQNIANVQTTRDVDGKPYQRRVVVVDTVPVNTVNTVNSNGGAAPATLQVAHVEKDRSPFVKIYAPGHPDADMHGMVAMPNVNITQELADFVMTQRAFEANLSVLKMAGAMAMQSSSHGTRILIDDFE